MSGMNVSRRLALVIGVLLPIAELYRRRHQLADLSMFPAWFDDMLIGAFLLYGVWRTREGRESGRMFLAAAWAFMAGMAYGSFFGQLSELSKPDPSGASSMIVVANQGSRTRACVRRLGLDLLWPEVRSLVKPHTVDRG
jgi:hypothetical protein